MRAPPARGSETTGSVSNAWRWCTRSSGGTREAEAELKKMHSALGDAFAYEYAKIYAQWGDHAKALDWLETAKRLHDPGLAELKNDTAPRPTRARSRASRPSRGR